MKLPKVKSKLPKRTTGLLALIFLVISITLAGYLYYQNFSPAGILRRQLGELDQLKTQLNETKKQLTDLENQDQVKRNKNLEQEIKDIKDTFSSASKVYESLVDLQESKVNVSKLTPLFSKILAQLANQNYQDAKLTISELQNQINNLKPQSPTTINPSSVVQNNTPPSSGYNRQTVLTPTGSFVVSIIAANLSSTKVIVDTASESTCQNDCPVLPLATFVSRSGAYAGVNGTYFCPASYPACSSKTNSFDLLVMNKNKVYFNSENNVYSTNPAAIFGNTARFVTQAQQWGRDTSVDAVISNFPLLVFNNQLVYQTDTDPKHIVRGGRSFVANKGTDVFIGVVHSASVSESAQVLHSLGMENALNLDSGGSVALWSGGYKAGPGRDIPNAVLFVRR